MHMRAKTICGFALTAKSLCDITIWQSSYPTPVICGRCELAGYGTVLAFLCGKVRTLGVSPLPYPANYKSLGSLIDLYFALTDVKTISIFSGLTDYWYEPIHVQLYQYQYR